MLKIILKKKKERNVIFDGRGGQAMVERERRGHCDCVKGRIEKGVNCLQKMEHHLTAIHYFFSELDLKLSRVSWFT